MTNLTRLTGIFVRHFGCNGKNDRKLLEFYIELACSRRLDGGEWRKMVSAEKIAEERKSRRGGSFAFTHYSTPSQPRPQGEVDPSLSFPVPTVCAQRLQQASIEKSNYSVQEGLCYLCF